MKSTRQKEHEKEKSIKEITQRVEELYYIILYYSLRTDKLFPVDDNKQRNVS
jgi:hypothetical protein